MIVDHDATGCLAGKAVGVLDHGVFYHVAGCGDN